MTSFAKLKIWLLKRLKPKDSECITTKNVYIVPTREGLMFALLVVIVLAAAINFNNSLVFFFTFLLAGFGLISMWMTQQNLLGLEFSIGHVKPVFSSQPLHFPLLIQQSKNAKASSTIDHFSIAVQFALQKNSASVADKMDLNMVDVHHHEKSLLQLSSSSSRRGHYVLAPITVSSTYPLGLFYAWANVQLNSDALVYPKPARRFEHKAQQGGDNSDGQASQGRGFDDFSGFKSYQPGEPLHHVHWKAYAREQGMLSKTFLGAQHQDYWLDWHDLSGDTESRLSQLCRLIIDAQEQGDRYGLVLPNARIAIGQGLQHQHQCLKLLALYPGGQQNASS